MSAPLAAARGDDDALKSAVDDSAAATVAASVPSVKGGGSWTQSDVEKLVEPYVRQSPPWNVYEVCKTVLATVFLLPLRFAFLALSGLVVWLLAALAMAGVRREDRAEFVLRPLHPVRNALIQAMFPVIRALAFVCFGVVRIEHARPPAVSKGDASAFVVVANHLGYLDIVVLLCVFRASFVSKGAFERLPVVGTIAAALQCLFVRQGESLTTQLVDRVRRTAACHAAHSVACPGCPGCLNTLVIFPEGTTANGSAMVAFRTGVFNAAESVRPVCVTFPHQHWNMSWETVRFRTHLFRTMTQLVNHVRIEELPVYVPDEAERADARLYAANVQRVMADKLTQRVYLLNRHHKLLYHSYVLGKANPDSVRERAAEITAGDKQLQYLAESEVYDAI